MKRILYDKHSWRNCGDLEVVARLIGTQLGHIKCYCLLCEWDSRARKSHYSYKQWPLRQALIRGEKKVNSHVLVNPDKN